METSKTTIHHVTVTSTDGTQIGYRQYGQGRGLVLVQGAMGTAYNYKELAEALADTFTVYVPDRRGRGMSPRAYSPDYTIERDVEDLGSILEKTGAHFCLRIELGGNHHNGICTNIVFYSPSSYL
jgi:pimeloyl-ACP methyl ester carboxylesterase